MGSKFQELQQKYLSLQQSYEEALREKQEAFEENERATISFAVHFDQEISGLNLQIETLTAERDKANIEVVASRIKLESSKYELNRLHREHIKLQLEEEKYLEREERFADQLKQLEDEKNGLKEELLKLKSCLKEDMMDGVEQDESLLDNEGQNLLRRSPVTVKKSKVDEHYDVHEELGRGKFGVVKKVTKKETNEIFAAKWVKVTSQTRPDVLQEIEIMGKLNHKRLVGLYDAYEVARSIVLVMEFITGGELFERIANEESVTEKECVHYMRQLLEGLQYMHKNNIVHLDLKPENIVCVSKDTWDIKLIDFGLAKELKPGTTVKTMQGTPEFVAPEIINFEPVSLASDMWSVGVVAYILVSGLSPFLGDDNNETLSYVTTAEYDFEDESFDDISGEAKDFIEKLLHKAPNKRKTAEECLKHEWIKKNKGNNKIKTENLKKFLAKRRWQKSVNAVRAVRRLSSMSSLFSASLKGKSKSVVKLDEAMNEQKPVLTKRELSKSTPSVFLAEQQLSKRAMKILDSDEGSQSESGSVEQMNNSGVDDKDILVGLFKENKDILEFLNTAHKKEGEGSETSLKEEGLGEISEETNSEEQEAKPSFLEPLPATHTVPKGTPVLMTCTAQGNPPPTITWLRGDTTLKNEDGDVQIDLQGNTSSMSIGQCELQDEGKYLCVAENHLGQISCCTKLEVQVSPDFLREMKDVSILERRRVQFDVQISGQPSPTVKWYHNNVMLHDDRCIKLRKNTTDHVYSLVIRSATEDRRGNYKCVITNPLDTVTCTAKLHIEGYSDDEDEEEEENEDNIENEEKDIEDKENEEKNIENKENEEKKEEEKEKVNKREVKVVDHSRVSLKQEDIELYYDIKEEIGKGRFGVIHYGVHKATGREYAVKYIKVRKSQKDQYQQEIDIMNHLRHRRFIRLYEAFEEPRRLILVLELMCGGELLERISEKDFIAELEITKYMKQILEGVKDMHEKGVLHLDLKPQNIMFTTQDSSNLKLIDFGLAHKLNAKKELKIVFGTPEFVAPEVVNYELITPATDMWSVGVITYILLSGVSPFWNDDPDTTLSNVTRAEWRLPDLLFQNVSDDAKDFLKKLLIKDPSKRMKVEEAFQHPWIQAVQKKQERNNLISTQRLKKYHAHQKGLASRHDAILRETTKETKDRTEHTTEMEEVDGKIELDDHLVTLTTDRAELHYKLEVSLKNQNDQEVELLSLKGINKEQQTAMRELEKRNKLLEERNRSSQEGAQRLIKLECDKSEIEEKCQQKEIKYHDLSKKYESLREKADSCDVLEEKVFHLERERKTSQSNSKMMEEQLKKLQEENEALQVHGIRTSIAEDEEEDIFEEKTRVKEKLENKIELLSKDLEIAQEEIHRLSTVVNSQLEDLDELERITEQKRKLETRCKELEEQLVEQEHEGVQREKEIDEMEEDIMDIQRKLQKSHNELRTVLEENKQLKVRLVEEEVISRGHKTQARKVNEESKHNGHSEMLNGKGSFHEANEETSDLLEKNGWLSAKCYQLEKELEMMLINHSADAIGDNEDNEGGNSDSVEQNDDLVSEPASLVSTGLRNMDLKQLRQLSKKLMKANKSLTLSNEKLNHDKQHIESQNEQLRNEFERKLHGLEKENETFKRLLKTGDNITVEEILNKTNADALESEILNQQEKISDLKNTYGDLEQSKKNKIEEGNIQWRYEQKIKTMNNDKCILVSKYEKELEESQNYFLEEKNKFKRLCEERIASVEKQNQNLKSQINELMTFSENKKNSCGEHVKQLNELKRLHEEEFEEMEKNLALILSQQVQDLTSIAEQEKSKLTKEKDSEVNTLRESCQDLNEVINSLQEQVTNYPEMIEKNEDLKNELTKEKERCEALEEQLQTERKAVCPNCKALDNRVSELKKELVALRKLEEDNMLLASENEKLIEELELERQRLELCENNNISSESKMKLEELDNEKSSSKFRENSKKSLKRKVSQLDKDCKDLSRKLQNEILKNKQQELEISRGTSEKQKILQDLLKAQLFNRTSDEINDAKRNKTGGVLDSCIQGSAVDGEVDGEETGSVNEEKDNDYHMIKEELKKSQNRTHLLQTEIDRLRESYSNNLSKEMEEMENKWTQRLRRECNAVHSEMADELRKQKDAWKKKESELHSVIKELRIQVEEIETERRRLEKECNGLKGNLQNGTNTSEYMLVFSPQNDQLKNTEQETDENIIQETINDRDLRRVAYKLKKDQWSRLGIFLSLTEADIREINQQKIGKEEKAFRVLCQWRTNDRGSNQASRLAVALEEIRRNDLAQFVMEHCASGKCRKKLIG